MDKWYKQLKSAGYREKTRQEKNVKASKKAAHRTKRTKALLQEKINLCKKAFRARRELKSKLSDTYYNSTMKALNMGGLLLVSPKFFDWGLNTMKVIRAALQERLIKTLGSEAQEKAYHFVVNNRELLQQFQTAVRSELGTSFQETISQTVHFEILEYAFNARTQVEWKRYKAHTTDRSAGKEKKLGLREFLKAAGCSQSSYVNNAE